MTPEERKAIAMRQHPPRPCLAKYGLPGYVHYPKCCNYHEGFDDALALLAKLTVTDGDDVDVVLYAIEATP